MPGHNPQRTSYAGKDSCISCSKPLWHRKIDPLIPSRAQLITVEASAGAPDLLLVPTAAGLYALNPQTGAQLWLYAMELPPGDSPAVVGGVVYIGGTDKTIHAVNASTGAKIWQTDEAGAAFYTSPLVVNDRVYAGSRDGYFYCFDAKTGKMVWFYEAGAPVSFAAAYQTYSDQPNGVIFFADHKAYAHALKADTGKLIWKSAKLPAHRFAGFWPVVTGEIVLFASVSHYPASNATGLHALARDSGILFADEAAATSAIKADGFIDFAHHVNYLKQYPERRTIFVLDRKTGGQAEVAPFLYWGNPGGQRFPPAIGPDGLVWANSPLITSFFTTGRYLGWKPGTTLAQPLPKNMTSLESADEPEAHAIIGSSLYRNDGGDGVDKGGCFALTTTSSCSWMGSDTLQTAFGAYWGDWGKRKYGNELIVATGWKASFGWHGHQNPPVPLKGKIYFHRSNAVICMGP